MRTEPGRTCLVARAATLAAGLRVTPYCRPLVMAPRQHGAGAASRGVNTGFGIRGQFHSKQSGPIAHGPDIDLAHVPLNIPTKISEHLSGSGKIKVIFFFIRMGIMNGRHGTYITGHKDEKRCLQYIPASASAKR